MTIACTDCTRCGKCYDKNSTCLVCGSPIYLLDDVCSVCGEPITQEQRDTARQSYINKKKAEKDEVLRLASEARKRREEKEALKPKVKYPWE